MKISDKWKRFALRHHLSDWEGDAIALFDALITEADLASVFEKHDVTPWYVFEYMDTDNPEELARAIESMARDAQETEAQKVTA